MQTNAGYASYMLRLRHVRSDDRAIWVASVQSTATGEQRSFSSVDALVAFLQAEFGRSQEEVSHQLRPDG